MTTHFNNTKYTRWYYAIIQKRAILDNDTRGEVHHIIPRSLGGSDEPTNLVKLSGHDHAWCHWLLTKMTVGMNRASMIYAFNMMGVCGDHMKRQSSYAIVRAYEKNRLEWSETHSATMKGKEPWNKGKKEDRPEILAKIKEAALNRPKQSAESHAKSGANRKGLKRSEETKAKMKASQTGIPKPKSNEFREQVRAKLIGIPKRKDHGEAVAAANMGVVSINKNNIEKKVKQPQLQEYLDDGWVLGGRPRKKK